MATVSNSDGTTVRASTYPDQLVASRLSDHEKGREFSSMSSFRDSLVDQGHCIVNAALCCRFTSSRSAERLHPPVEQSKEN